MFKYILIFTLIAFAACETPQCLSSIEGIKSTLSSLVHLKTWEDSSLRSQSLSALLGSLVTIENECKVCGGEALTMKTEITQIITDVQDSDWMKLIGEAVTTFQTADQFYDSCVSSESISFVAADSCVGSVVSIKSALGQLTQLKNWENSASRSTLLSSLIGVLFTIDQDCQACSSDVLSAKSGIVQIVQDVKSQDWFKLVGEAFTTLEQLDGLYNCATGQTSFIQQSCVSTVESIKSSLSSLTDISTWTNAASRDQLLGSLAGVLVGIEQTCLVCSSDAMTIKSDVEQIISDANTQDWFGIVTEVISAASDADTLYQCATGSSAQTNFVVSQNCMTVIEGIKGTLSSLLHLDTWTNSQLRDSTLSALPAALSQIEQNCSVCAVSAEQVKNEVEQLISDAEGQDWINLIEEAYQAYESADSLYSTCIEQ